MRQDLRTCIVQKRVCQSWRVPSNSKAGRGALVEVFVDVGHSFSGHFRVPLRFPMFKRACLPKQALRRGLVTLAWNSPGDLEEGRGWRDQGFRNYHSCGFLWAFSMQRVWKGNLLEGPGGSKDKSGSGKRVVTSGNAAKESGAEQLQPASLGVLVLRTCQRECLRCMATARGIPSTFGRTAGWDAQAKPTSIWQVRGVVLAETRPVWELD